MQNSVQIQIATVSVIQIACEQDTLTMQLVSWV